MHNVAIEMGRIVKFIILLYKNRALVIVWTFMIATFGPATFRQRILKGLSSCRLQLALPVVVIKWLKVLKSLTLVLQLLLFIVLPFHDDHIVQFMPRDAIFCEIIYFLLLRISQFDWLSFNRWIQWAFVILWSFYINFFSWLCAIIRYSSFVGFYKDLVVFLLVFHWIFKFIRRRQDVLNRLNRSIMDAFYFWHWFCSVCGMAPFLLWVVPYYWFCSCFTGF